MPLTHIEHYLVLTDDLDGTRNFYCKGLGMRVGARPPMAFSGYWLYAGEIPCIHVAEWESYRAYSTEAGIGISTRAPGTGPVDHIAFNGTDFESIKSALIAHGVKFAVNELPSVMLRQLFTHDPNGVKIEINVRDPRAAPEEPVP